MKLIAGILYYISISFYAWDLGKFGQFQFDNKGMVFKTNFSTYQQIIPGN